ncbi:MAG: hypothetical protein NT079_03355, partial [Candidatus Omnitrophica bacterium]|nr:hypothetical protein [Candidatus Omnitrophota bacterium]
KQKTYWAWKIYFFPYSLVILLNLLFLFSEGSPINQYYRILIAFKQSYFILYSFYAARMIIEILALIPLFLFVFRIRLFPAFVWQILFGARIFTLFSGHFYEWSAMRALMHANPIAAICAMASAVLFAIPSYTACYIYAFKRKNFLGNN